MNWRYRPTILLAGLLLADAIGYLYLRSMYERGWAAWDYFWYATVASLITISVMVIEGGGRRASHRKREGVGDKSHRTLSSAWRSDGPRVTDHRSDVNSDGLLNDVPMAEADHHDRNELATRLPRLTHRRRSRPRSRKPKMMGALFRRDR